MFEDDKNRVLLLFYRLLATTADYLGPYYQSPVGAVVAGLRWPFNFSSPDGVTRSRIVLSSRYDGAGSDVGSNVYRRNRPNVVCARCSLLLRPR